MTDIDRLEEACASGASAPLLEWERTFKIYNYCLRCSDNGFGNAHHDPSNCKCCCHVKAMMQWIHKNAHELSLELVTKMIGMMEENMATAVMPIRTIDEMRKMRDEAVEAAAVKPL